MKLYVCIIITKLLDANHQFIINIYKTLFINNPVK